MGKKVVCIMLALCTVLALCIPAFAKSDDDEIKVRRIEMNIETATVRVNQSRTLWVLITPANAEDKDITWSTSNAEIVDVDGEGMITGISPGTATITATSANNKTTTCFVTVPQTALTGIHQDITNADRTETTVDGGEILSAAALRLDAENAVKEAGKGSAVTLSYSNKSTVSTAALRAAAFAAEYNKGEVMLRFITPGSGQAQGQIAINPKQAPSEDLDLKLRVYTSAAQTAEIDTAVRSKIRGAYSVIRLTQADSYGMPVRITAKVDTSGMNTKNLKLYRYSPAAGTFTPLEKPDYNLTDNGYIQFTAYQGGAVIVTDQTLS